jgi:hypothetical protein
VGREPKSKHPFEKILDTEQVFVMGWRHDEHRFDEPPVGRSPSCRVERELSEMTALWLEPSPRVRPLGPTGGRRSFRLVEGDLRPAAREAWGTREAWEDWEDGDFDADESGVTGLVLVPGRRATGMRRRTSPEVRRRRTLVAAIGLMLIALALPLSGTGGRSHATGSASVEIGAGTVYTVHQGDTLWSIAERVQPSSDPRPLVAQLAKETGSNTVVPGERIAIP